VNTAHLGGQRPWLQDLRLGGQRLVHSGADRLVPADVRCDHASDDCCRDQCEQHARGDQPLLVAPPLRLGTPQL
jgi:hypothetical protein